MISELVKTGGGYSVRDVYKELIVFRQFQIIKQAVSKNRLLHILDI